MRVAELWIKYRAHLEQASPSPHSDFRWIVKEVFKNHQIVINIQDDKVLTDSLQSEIEKLLERRIAGEPVGYIFGYWEFWARKFFVGPGVLIPRPETESLVEQAKKFFTREQKFNFADFGSGTGCLALTLALEFPRSIGLAVEASSEAASYFKKNWQQFNLESRVTLLESNVESLGFEYQANFDLVVMNPPYIAEGDERVDRSVRMFEPHQALFAGEHGLQSIRQWADKAASILKSGGLMFCEFGHGQAADVLEIVTSARNFSSVEIKTDLSGIDRFVVARKI